MTRLRLTQIVFLSCLNVVFVFHYSNAEAALAVAEDIESRELELLMQTSNPREFRKTEKLLRNRQVAEENCKAQLHTEILPLVCFKLQILEKQLDMKGSIVLGQLSTRCLSAARRVSNTEISLEMKKLLPLQCLEQLIQTVKINRYKAHLNPL